MNTTIPLFFLEEEDLIDLRDYWGDDMDNVFEQEMEYDNLVNEYLPENLDSLNFGPDGGFGGIPFDDNNKLLSYDDLKTFLRIPGNSLNTLYLNKFHLRNPKNWRKILYILNIELVIDDILDIPDSWLAFLQILINRYNIGYLTQDEVEFILYKLIPIWQYIDENIYINRLYNFLKYVERLYQDENFENIIQRRRTFIDDWNMQRIRDINERNILINEIMESGVDIDELFIENNPNLLYELDEDNYSDED